MMTSERLAQVSMQFTRYTIDGAPYLDPAVEELVTEIARLQGDIKSLRAESAQLVRDRLELSKLVLLIRDEERRLTEGNVAAWLRSRRNFDGYELMPIGSLQEAADEIAAGKYKNGDG